MIRFSPMHRKTIALTLISAAALLASGCKRDAPEPAPSEAPATPLPTVAPAPVHEPSPSPSAAPVTQEDRHGDPDKILRSYAAALKARDWNGAARLWGKNSGVTAAILKAAYDRPERPVLEIGKGTQEGAAGSLFYEAPVVLRFGGDAAPEKGTLTLRRVNDVDGATPEQLRWHIERATIGIGQ